LLHAISIAPTEHQRTHLGSRRLLAVPAGPRFWLVEGAWRDWRGLAAVRGRAPTEAFAPSDLFPTGQWDDNKRVLAEALPKVVWALLPRYFHTLPKARLLITRLEPGESFEQTQLELLTSSLELARDVSEALEKCDAPLRD
jgi:hypothetical protein